MSRHPPHRSESLAWIEQTGSAAAQENRSWQSNPYLRRENMPLQTRESLHEWSCKHDAWQFGFEQDGQAEGTRKQRLDRSALASLVGQRVRWILEMRNELELHPEMTVRLEPPIAHVRDARGRNWDVPGCRCGDIEMSRRDAVFRTAVDELRDRFDLA